MIFNNGIFIQVDSKRCLNQIHSRVNCNHCLDHCPAHALTINNNHILLDKDKCFGCGLCFSECPTEVFTEPHWDETTIINEVKNQAAKTTQFFCEKHVLPYRTKEQNDDGAVQIPACLSSVSKGAWYEIASLTSVELRLENCSDCKMNECLSRLKYSVETASEWLVSTGIRPTFAYTYHDELAVVRKKYKAVPTGMKVTSRRDLFLSVIGRGSKLLDDALNKDANTSSSSDMSKKEGKKYLPDWKRRLEAKYTDHIQGEHPAAYWPSLEIDSGCVFCQMCSNNCPSGALTTSIEDGIGRHTFVSGNCLDCRICMLFCPTESISRDRVQIDHPFTKKYIKRAEVTACTQCGSTTLFNAKNTCYLCENEADDSDMITNVLGLLYNSDLQVTQLLK